jgi:lipoyl-dependent peroxiredoxin
MLALDIYDVKKFTNRRTEMAIRKAGAEWKGNLLDGSGIMKIGNAYEGPYSFLSRFAEGPGTNPEELIAAAHAGCFSMAFSATLADSGYKPKSVKTTANVYIEKIGDGFTITKIHLETTGDVPGIEKAEFLRLADDAKKNCPVSRALASIEITLEAQLL